MKGENMPVNKYDYRHKSSILLICFAAAFLMSLHLAAQPLEWHFESGETTDWLPQTDTVTVTRTTDAAFPGHSRASLRISGKAESGGYSAVSGLRALNEFSHYRLTAWMKNDSHIHTSNQNSTGMLPYLACELKTSHQSGSLGIVTVDTVGEKLESGWQKLSTEFRTPYGTRQCRLIAANGSFTGNIDIYLDSITLEPIDSYSHEGKYNLDPIPSPLEHVRNVHPRLYLTEKRIDELRHHISGTHASIWREILAQAGQLEKNGPPEYRGNDEGRYDEQWWQARNAPSMITLALVYHITGEQRYLNAARKWALATCAYKTWGVGWADGIDCMTGHNLYGLGVVYDWCYNSFDNETRSIIRETLRNRAAFMFDKAAKGTIVPGIGEYRTRPWPEWDEAWLQNHLWVNSCGLAIAGLALFDEEDEASQWVGFALDRFRHTAELLGPDGASHEGINYWSYGLEHLLKFMYPARELLGVDLFDIEWFLNTANYRLHMSIPRNAWERNNTTVDYGDSYRRDYAGPDYLLRALAKEYRDGSAQWLARELDESETQLSGNQWLNLLWYDPSVAEKPPVETPPFFHFADMDYISARSGWSGDESFVFFKCGPYIGHKALDSMVYCPSSAHHTHPDQNHFTLFGSGEWLIRDDGNYGKYTGQHNTLLIDGGEQLGGGDSILDAVELHALKLKPYIISASSTTKLDHIAGDAAEAYPGSKKLRRFVRHLLFVKPDVLIVADDIVLDEAHNLELRFHPEQQTSERTGNVFITTGKKAVLRFEPLTVDGVEVFAGKHDLIDRRYNKSEMLAFQLQTRRKEWRNAVAMSWSGIHEQPAAVHCDMQGELWHFSVGKHHVVLDWKSGKARIRDE